MEAVQSICVYAEQTDADEEAEMAELRQEMALVRLLWPCYVLPVPELCATIQLRGRDTQQADLQKVRSENEKAQWELPASVDQDAFISDIRTRVEYFLQPLLDQLEAAETEETRLLKEACGQELEVKRTLRMGSGGIANALSIVAVVKKYIRESRQRQEAR